MTIEPLTIWQMCSGLDGAIPLKTWISWKNR